MCRRGGAVLLHKMVPDPWWAVPGGRVERGETAEQAMARELLEELGLVLSPGRLCAVIETHFAHHGIRFEEVGLYFEVEPTGVPGTAFSLQDGDRLLEFDWFPIGELEAIDIRPACIVQTVGGRARQDSASRSERLWIATCMLEQPLFVCWTIWITEGPSPVGEEADP